ncbi:MAG TPA: DUF4070 domain-containing protein, partial [Candidatus Methylomirabilis sp.]|nr:DUF4070 domain-containing protein [Candidatus Methylomirabilis sp.]
VDSLVETKKRQNVHKPLLESVRKIQSHNLIITAGMIVGFDHDDVRIFQEQFDFLMDAGIPFTTCGVLTAIEKTPLYARLEQEGRLLPYDSALIQGHGAADLNFVPRRMTVEEVHRGYNWLIRALYKSENYGARLTQALRQFLPRRDLTRQTVRQFDWGLIRVVPRLIRYFLLTRSRDRRRLFIRTLWQTMRSRPSLPKLVNALAYMIAHKHFHEYVTVTHGDPEAVGPLSPFTEAPAAPEWWGDAFNKEYVKRLRRELYAGAQGLLGVGRRLRRAVAVPEPLLTDTAGQFLRYYLNELGVEVVPVAAAAISRLRDRVDLLVLPILGSVRKGREELHQRLQQVHERVQTELDRLPEVVHFSIDGDGRAVFDGFARIGLTFTRRITRLRQAYQKAVEAVMAPGARPAVRSGLLETR